MVDRLDWLKKLFDRPDGKAVSRAQLPRILEVVDWEGLNNVLTEMLSCRIEGVDGEWKAIDGKSLRGTIEDKKKAHSHEQIVSVIGHLSQKSYHHRQISGQKPSEIKAVRELLSNTELSSQKVTLDSLHTNPETLALINSSGGQFITQVKNNQPGLLSICRKIYETKVAYTNLYNQEKGHGRLEERRAKVFNFEPVELDKRWFSCGFRTLVIVKRQTKITKSGKERSSISYYLSNKEAEGNQSELFISAIRGHWQVEVNNHRRDVTFREDSVRTKKKGGQILSLLRTISMEIVKELSPGNMKKAIENFANKPKQLLERLQQWAFV